MKLKLQNWLILSLFLVFAGHLSAQTKYSWRDTFSGGTTYCPGDHQVDRWNTWRANIDTTNRKYEKLSVNGEFGSERTCADKTEIRRLMQAMKNSTAYSMSCNGYVWETDNAGACVSSGGCTSSQSVNQVFTVASGTGQTCGCTAANFTVRVNIGNPNWGAFNTTACWNPPSQWLEVVAEYPGFNFDIGVSSMTALDPCVPSQTIKATFSNTGKKQLDSFNWGYFINTTSYGPFKAKFKLPIQKDSVFTLQSSYTFSPNTTYNFKIWASKPNNQTDSNKNNDTLRFKFDFKGRPSAPDIRDSVLCGSQRVTLTATTSGVNDSVLWFSDRLGKNQIGTGKKFTTKMLSSNNPNAKYKFYASAYNGFIFGKNSLGNYSFTNYGYGNQFDIKAKANMMVDSILLNIYAGVTPVGNTFSAEVYIAEGVSFSGITTNSSAWTQVFNGTGVSKGSQKGSMIPVKFNMKANTTYAVYVHTPGQTILFDYTGGVTRTGTDMDIVTGNAAQSLFGSIINGYDIDGEIFYKKPLCPSLTDSATITVNPLPTGATLTPSTPFDVAPLNGGNGSGAKPYVVAIGDTLSFDLNAPTSLAYTNASHGTNWKVTSQSVKTPKGYVLTSGTNWGWTDPNSSNTGEFWFTPSAAIVDSTFDVIVRFQDMGTNGCDSFVRTRIYVAPLPEPNFNRQSKICDGDGIIFNNTSKIKTGFLNYKWDFGNGDTSDAASPVYFYNTYGTYIVTLKAISGIYGYIVTKKDTLVVTQIPKVAFDVLNVCEKQTTKFTNKTTVSGGTLSYIWEFGDATANSTVTSPTHKYTLAKRYSVTLTASANGCSASRTKNAYVFAKPVASFTFPSGSGIKYCSGAEVPFTNTSTISSGNVGAMWTFGDGELGTLISPSHDYATGGNYNVQLISISEFGCADTTKKPIQILSSPKAAFNVDATCNRTPSVFTSAGVSTIPSGETSNFSWNFGDGGTSSSENPTYQFTKVGPTNVKFLMSLTNGCKDSIIKTLTVGAQATVDFAGQNVCSGQPLPFDNKTTWDQGNITYAWDFGDITSSTDADPIKTYTTATTKTYNVTLVTKIDGGCPTSKTKTVTVYQLPVPTFTVADDWTPGNGWRTVKVTALNSAYPFYRYKMSDGGSLNASTGKYQFTYDGSFTITLCVRNEADCEACETQTKNIYNSLGTNNTAAGKLSLFPNPTTGIINVNVAEGVTLNKVEVVNSIGEVVASQNGNTSINISNQSQGIYLVRLYTNNGVVIQKVNLIK